MCPSKTYGFDLGQIEVTTAIPHPKQLLYTMCIQNMIYKNLRMREEHNKQPSSPNERFVGREGHSFLQNRHQLPHILKLFFSQSKMLHSKGLRTIFFYSNENILPKIKAPPYGIWNRSFDILLRHQQNFFISTLVSNHYCTKRSVTFCVWGEGAMDMICDNRAEREKTHIQG